MHNRVGVAGGTVAQMKALREIMTFYNHGWNFSMALHFATLISQGSKPEKQ